MMRDILLIVASFVLCMLTSCEKELVYDPFNSPENGMSRYLSQIEETIYTTTGLTQKETVSILFNSPMYKTDGKLSTAYNNISGYDANYSYSYSDEKIEIIANCKNGDIKRWQYILQNKIIISCKESSNRSGFQKTYHYSYDACQRLNKITVFDEESGFHSEINIEWKNENITSVNMMFDSGYTAHYDFKYNKCCSSQPKLPFFFTVCYEIGGVYGVDEFLSMQNYFGINMSTNLPDDVYYNGLLSQVFEYKTDIRGSVQKISQLDKNRKKIIRTYIFKWS